MNIYANFTHFPHLDYTLCIFLTYSVFFTYLYVAFMYYNGEVET